MFSSPEKSAEIIGKRLRNLTRLRTTAPGMLKEISRKCCGAAIVQW